MAGFTTVEVTNYRLALFSQAAKITLYNAQGIPFAAAFVRPESESLTENYQDPTGLYRLYFHYSALPALVDLLRNESPVYLHYWYQGGSNCHLATSVEPATLRPVWPVTESGCSMIEWRNPPISALAPTPAPTVASRRPGNSAL